VSRGGRRERRLELAPLVLLLAASLTNVACPQEPPFTPPCQSLSDTTCDRCAQGGGSGAPWAEGTVAWDSYGGETILRLRIVTAAEVSLPDAYTVVGGTLLPPPAGASEMMIKPDAGATRIRLAGALTCEKKTLPFTITVYLVAPDYDPSAKLPYVDVFPL
jgi:hypothetical protein